MNAIIEKEEVKIQHVTNTTEIEKIQNFLFHIIKEDFGFNYVPQYHQDIVQFDKYYLQPKRSAFFVAWFSGTNEIAGTFGVRGYDRKFAQFENRYNSTSTAVFNRTFINKTFRRKGLGQWHSLKKCTHSLKGM